MKNQKESGVIHSKVVLYSVILSVFLIFMFVFSFLSQIHQTSLSYHRQKMSLLVSEIEQSLFFQTRSELLKMAELPEFLNLFENFSSQDVAKEEEFLNKVNLVLHQGMIYLMDTSGTVIVSSTNRQGESFRGNNYAFRPYFKKAMQGDLAVYTAKGVTSKKRGVYFSQAVRNLQGKIVGVLVIKQDVEELCPILFAYPDLEVLLITDGVIFASSNPDWNFHYLPSLDSFQVNKIQKSRRYGDEVLKPFFDDLEGSTLSLGKRKMSVLSYPLSISGWRLVTLHKLRVSFWQVLKRGSMLVSLFLLLLLLLCIPTFLNLFLMRKQIQQKLKEVEDLEPLTGFLNRTKGMELFEQQFLKVKLSDTEVFASLWKFENIAEINQQYGYSVGDHSMRQIGEVFKSSLKDKGIVFWFTDHKWIVFHKQNSLAEVRSFCEHLLSKVSKLNQEKDGKHQIHLSYVVVSSLLAETPYEWIQLLLAESA